MQWNNIQQKEKSIYFIQIDSLAGFTIQLLRSVFALFMPGDPRETTALPLRELPIIEL